MQSMCYGKQKTEFCKIYATPTLTCTPQKTANSNGNISNGWLGAEQKENMKMLQFNSSEVQCPQLTEHKALNLCPYKTMVH